MRKDFLYILFMFCFMACSSDDSFENINNKSMEACLYNDSNRRSYTEAMEIALNSIEMIQSENTLTRGTEPIRTLNIEDGVKAIKQLVTRSNGDRAKNDTLLYIFNFNNNLGFAVISASRQTEGLIAVTEKGNYDPTNPTGNPAFESYMQMAKEYVANADRTPYKKENLGTRSTTNQEIKMCKPVYDTIYCSDIKPMLSVRWGQEGAIGQYCPNNVSGCSNTAAAQIMTYFKYPNYLNLTFPEKDVNTTVLDWNAICSHEYSYFYYYDDADKQIGRLARQLGKLAQSIYKSYNNCDSNFTSTIIDNEREALQSIGYNVSDINTYSYKNSDKSPNYDSGLSLSRMLGEGKLIYMRGGYNKNEGHAWVIDGCLYVKALHRMMATYDGETWFIYQELGTYRKDYNHINWGWDGKQNGYFLYSIFNPYNAVTYDSSTKNSTDFSKLCYNIDIQYFSVWH